MAATHRFDAPTELAIGMGVPEFLDLMHALLPDALAPAVEGELRDRIGKVADHCIRKILAGVLTPVVHVDASKTDAPIGVIDNG